MARGLWRRLGFRHWPGLGQSRRRCEGRCASSWRMSMGVWKESRGPRVPFAHSGAQPQTELRQVNSNGHKSIACRALTCGKLLTFLLAFIFVVLWSAETGSWTNPSHDGVDRGGDGRSTNMQSSPPGFHYVVIDRGHSLVLKCMT